MNWMEQMRCYDSLNLKEIWSKDRISVGGNCFAKKNNKKIKEMGRKYLSVSCHQIFYGWAIIFSLAHSNNGFRSRAKKKWYHLKTTVNMLHAIAVKIIMIRWKTGEENELVQMKWGREDRRVPFVCVCRHMCLLLFLFFHSIYLNFNEICYLNPRHSIAFLRTI